MIAADYSGPARRRQQFVAHMHRFAAASRSRLAVAAQAGPRLDAAQFVVAAQAGPRLDAASVAQFADALDVRVPAVLDVVRDRVVKRYAPQNTYSGGACMCTTAAVFWSVMCAAKLAVPLCKNENMRSLMHKASAAHVALTKRLGQRSTYMLQQNEVSLCSRMPS